MKLPAATETMLAVIIKRIEDLRTPGASSGPSEASKLDNQTYVDHWILPQLKGILKDSLFKRPVQKTSWGEDRDAFPIIKRLLSEGPRP